MNTRSYDPPEFLVEKRYVREAMTMLQEHNAYELYYLTNGEATYLLSGRSYRLSAGAFVLIPPRLLHSTPRHMATRIVGYFTLGFLRRHFSEEAVASLSLPTDTAKVLRFAPTGAAELFSQLIHSLLAAYEAKKEVAPDGCGTGARLLFTVLSLLAENGSAEHIPSQGKQIAEVLAYIDEHYAETLCMEEVASHFHYSKYHLCRLFKNQLSASFTEYLLLTRISHAIELLQAGYSVTETANTCGFHSTAYFSKCFKDQIHMTPIEYKALQSSKNSEN